MVKHASQSNSNRHLTTHESSQVVQRLTNHNQINDMIIVNDPSAGSPTETLLRLLLPLNDKIYSTSREAETSEPVRTLNPWYSSDHSIGRSDGRCVQRAGT